MTTGREISATIMAQLGGAQFARMTGARWVTFNQEGTTHIKLPANFAKDGINYVGIELTPADLYKMTFYKVRGLKMTTVSEHDHLYADQLAPTFTEVTGLDTVMPKVLRKC